MRLTVLWNTGALYVTEIGKSFDIKALSEN